MISLAQQGRTGRYERIHQGKLPSSGIVGIGHPGIPSNRLGPAGDGNSPTLPQELGR